MRLEGNPEVLRNLWRKKYMLEAGSADHSQYRPALLSCAGVIRGVYGVGQEFALHKAGLDQVFDVALGVSTGLPAICYLLTGQERESIYWNEAISPEFMSWKRFLLRKGPLVDIDYICGVFKDIDQKKLRASRTQLFAGATSAETGSPIFLDVKNDDSDAVEIIKASIAMPEFTGPVKIGGRLCIDGATALTFPVQRLVEKWAPTDLLVLANRAGFSKGGIFLDELIALAALWKLPKEVLRTHLRRHEQAQKELNYLRAQKNCRWAILWSDGEVERFERDPKKVEAAFVRSSAHLSSLLDHARLEVGDEREQILAKE